MHNSTHWGECGCTHHASDDCHRNVNQATSQNFGATDPPDSTTVANAMNISVGRHSTCALLGDRTDECWGRNQYNELGDAGGQNQHAPVTVQGLPGATVVAAKNTATCALVSGDVWCWGSDTASRQPEATGF